MTCLKCGKETGDARVFCESCLAVMDAYPVLPGTAVQIPQRPKKRGNTTHRVPTPAQQLARLRTVTRRLVVTVVILLLLLGITTGLLVYTLTDKGSPTNWGQNYSATKQTSAFVSRETKC